MQFFVFDSSVLIEKKDKKKTRRRNKGVYLYTLPISFASYHRLSHWVPNQSLD